MKLKTDYYDFKFDQKLFSFSLILWLNQSWALSVFWNFFNNKKSIYAFFIKLICSALDSFTHPRCVPEEVGPHDDDDVVHRHPADEVNPSVPRAQMHKNPPIYLWADL